MSYCIDAKHENHGNNWDSDYVSNIPIKYLKQAKAYLKQLLKDSEWSGWEFKIVNIDTGEEIEYACNTIKVARVFQENTGKYHYCSDELDYLDARGQGFSSKAKALTAAHNAGYTHAIGSGCSWDGIKRIPAKYKTI